MPRNKGNTQKTNCYKCKVTINDYELMPLTEFKTLRDIADTLGMTYSQISDINIGRVSKKYSFKYMPDIYIERL